VAECIVLKGGGADLDVVTAGVGDVLAGKVIVGADGEPLTGTMANRGAVSQALNAGGSYTVPAGYHNGSGSVTANSLSSQTSATAAAGQILSGYTAWVNGSKLTGSIASLAGQTITPSASQQTISSSGKYMTGNVVVNAVSNLSAANVKKGVVVGGVTGTFEGYVPTATDFYLRGNNIKGWYSDYSYTSFDSGQITLLYNSTNNNVIKTNVNVSFVGYNYLNVEFYISNLQSSTEARVGIYSFNSINTTSKVVYVTSAGDKTISIPINDMQASSILGVAFRYWLGAVYRIWLS